MSDPVTTPVADGDRDSVSTAESAPVSARAPVRTRQSTAAVTPSEVWGLTSSDRRFLLISLLITAGLLGAHAWQQSVRSAYRVEVLRAPQAAAAIPQPERKPDVSEERLRQEPPTSVPPLAESYVYQIDINQATWSEWAQLPGIGETLARRIVAERESDGPFKSIDDLRRVKGIGAKTLEKMRPHLRVPSRL